MAPYIRYIKLAILLVVLQAALFFLALFIVIGIRQDCSFTNTPAWQCSGSYNPLVIPYVVVVAGPPLLANWLLAKLKRKFSWKEILITHALVLFAVLVYVIAANSRQSGG